MIQRGLMLGDVDPLDFRIAKTLGMPLYAVRALPSHEIEEWRAYFVYEDGMKNPIRKL